MIWSSTIAMTVIDLMIIGVVVGVFLVAVKTKIQLKASAPGARMTQRGRGARAQSDSLSLMFSWARPSFGTGTLSLNGNAAKRRQERQEGQERQEKSSWIRSPPWSPALPAFLLAFWDVPVQRLFNPMFFLCVPLRPPRLCGDPFFSVA